MKKLLALGVMFLAMVVLVGAADPTKEIQEKLKEKGYYQGVADGIIGAGTTNAIRMFQVDNELEPDGIAGQKTLAALGIDLIKNKTTGTAGVKNQSHINLLAKFIQAEAGDQPYEVRVAVGAVAINRLKHEKFPNTLAGVVFQLDAFTAVRDGHMSMKPTEDTVNAANAALAGEDPTEGCLYYYNPGTENRKYVLEREPKTSLGKYRFCI